MNSFVSLFSPAKPVKNSSVDLSEVGFHAPRGLKCTRAASGCPTNDDPSGTCDHHLKNDGSVTFSRDKCLTPVVCMQKDDHHIESYLTIDSDLKQLSLIVAGKASRFKDLEEQRVWDIALTKNKDDDLEVLTNAIKHLVKDGWRRSTQLETVLSQHPEAIAEELWTMLYSQSEPAETEDMTTTSIVPTDDRIV